MTITKFIPHPLLHLKFTQSEARAFWLELSPYLGAGTFSEIAHKILKLNKAFKDVKSGQCYDLAFPTLEQMLIYLSMQGKISTQTYFKAKQIMRASEDTVISITVEDEQA